MALLGVEAVGFGGAARADSPSAQGWWTTANPGNAGGVAAPAAPPAPPDVPSNGLLIEGGPTTASGAADGGSTAYAALTYDVPDGATVGKLTLAVAPSSATTPATTLELCPLTNLRFQPEDGGPMSDAPSYSCANNATAAPASSTYEFDVSSMVSSGALAVAILPTSPSDRVVLSQPDSKSLEVHPPADTTVPSVGGSPGGAGSSSGSDLTGGANPGSFSGGGPATLGVPADLGAAVPAGSASVPAQTASAQPLLAQAQSPGGAAPAANGAALFASAANSSGPRPWVGVIFLVVLLLAAALWVGAGRSASAERPSSG